MNSYRSCSCRIDGCYRRGFTLVELMVVVGILALLLMFLVPLMSTAQERGRIANCSSVLHNIGSAMAQYVSDNRGYLMPYVGVDWQAYEMLSKPPHVHSNDRGEVWDDTGYAYFTYHNLLAPYLGLGHCMPLDAGNNINQPNWGRARFSDFKAYQCPAGLGKQIPCGWKTSGFYMLNACWGSQWQRLAGPAWPLRSAYIPSLTDASVSILVYEFWSCNGMTADAEAVAPPYSTHFRTSSRMGGAIGIGRNMLYADYRVKFVSSGDDPERPIKLPWYNGEVFQRGNEMVIPYTSSWDGKQYFAWYPLRDSKYSDGSPCIGLLERG